MLRHGAPSLSYAPVALVDARAHQLPAVDDAAPAAAARPRARAEPAGVSDARRHALGAEAQGRRFVIDWHNIGYTLLRTAARTVASGGAAGALVRAARRAPGGREPLRVARAGGVPEEPVRAFEHARAVRSAGVDLRARRACRARTLPAGVVRAAGHPRRRRRIHRLPDELDGRRGLRRRHRRRAAPRGPHSRLGDGEPDGAISRSRDSGHRRRREAHRVRTAVCGPAGAARAPAHAVARARRLPARGRQRRSGALPAPVFVGARHPDEGGRSVRRRRAGLRARLRGDAGRARETRHQRPAVFDGRAALERPVRFLRRHSRRRSDVRTPADRRAQVGADVVGRRVDAGGGARAAARDPSGRAVP